MLNEQIESNDKLTVSIVSDELRYALIDFRTVNPQKPYLSPLPIFSP